jgi:DNA-binding IclR family transcriptional regulator
MVVAEVAKAHPRGIKAGDISRALDYDQANTYIVLDALTKHGVVRKDASTRPYLFYLAPRMLS